MNLALESQPIDSNSLAHDLNQAANTMPFDESIVSDVTVCVFEGMLRLPIVPGFTEQLSGELLVATIHITGNWNGVVDVIATSTVATTTASAMFACDPKDVNPRRVTRCHG